MKTYVLRCRTCPNTLTWDNPTDGQTQTCFNCKMPWVLTKRNPDSKNFYLLSVESRKLYTEAKKPCLGPIHKPFKGRYGTYCLRCGIDMESGPAEISMEIPLPAGRGGIVVVEPSLKKKLKKLEKNREKRIKRLDYATAQQHLEDVKAFLVSGAVVPVIVLNDLRTETEQLLQEIMGRLDAAGEFEADVES